MKKLFARVLAGILIWSVSAGAQQKPSVQIVVEQLGQDATVCGIDRSSIESITALTLRNNGIQGGASRSNPYLYIQATVGATRNLNNNVTGCVAHAVAEMRFLGPAPKTTFKIRGNK